MNILPQGTEVMCDCGWNGKRADLVEVPASPTTTCPVCMGDPSRLNRIRPIGEHGERFLCACGWSGPESAFVPFLPTEPDFVCPVCRGDPEDTLTLVFDIDISLRECVICKCTDADCSQCVEATGSPCSWVSAPYADADVCSRCALEAVGIVLAIDKLTGPNCLPLQITDIAGDIFPAANRWRASQGEHHGAGATLEKALEALEAC
jgi:hypothetical protein